jgi:hypothetical protein
MFNTLSFVGLYVNRTEVILLKRRTRMETRTNHRKRVRHTWLAGATGILLLLPAMDCLAVDPMVWTLSPLQDTCGTVTLEGFLLDDGGAPCRVCFTYCDDLTPPFRCYPGYATAWQEGYTTGATFTATIAVAPGQHLEFQAEADNGVDRSSGNVCTFDVPHGTVVPNLANMTRAEAQTALEAVGLVLGTASGDPLGRVANQDPRAGGEACPGSAVAITLTRRQATVPDVIDMSEADARAVLEAAGFLVKVWAGPSDKDEGMVFKQEPVGGTVVLEGSEVELTISQGDGDDVVVITIPGLLAHWPMNENGGTRAADVAGGFHGTITGDVAWTEGQNGSALQFPGVQGSSVDVGTVPLNIGSNFTLACWIKIPEVFTWHDILAKGPKNAGHYELYVNGGGVKGEAAAYIPDLGDFGSGIRVDDDTWHHLAWTYDGSTLACYVDGGATGVKMWVVPGRSVVAEREQFRIGSLADGTNPFGGAIDDVRIYDYALSVDQIVTVMTPAVSGLMAYWPLDENTGRVVADVAGGFHGTLAGSVAWTEGQIGSALGFPGFQANNVHVPNAALNLGSDFTLACWIKIPEVFTWHDILAKGPKDTGHYELYVSGVRVKGEAAAYFPDLGDFWSGIRVDDDAWHHLAWTYDGSAMTCYVDGGATGTRTWPVPGGSVTAEREQFRIGSLVDGTNPFGGAIDDVRIYNRALAAEEVLVLLSVGQERPEVE